MNMKGTGILVDETTFDMQTDIVYDKNLIVQGPLIGNSTHQDQAFILYLYPGEWKEFPTLGVGIGDARLDEDWLGWRQRIRIQLENENFAIKDLEFNNINKLTIDADYNS
ncbi:MAG: hypothetical protein FWF54_04585 [Candidatus Azobacteroides sp.]|nr:hypothetical protein [Candidatus Azobacteroides sp.]